MQFITIGVQGKAFSIKSLGKKPEFPKNRRDLTAIGLGWFALRK